MPYWVAIDDKVSPYCTMYVVVEGCSITVVESGKSSTLDLSIQERISASKILLPSTY